MPDPSLVLDDRLVGQAATADMGPSASEVLTKLAAETHTCDVEQVVVCTPEADRVSHETRTTSSRSTLVMRRALADSADDLRAPRHRRRRLRLQRGRLGPGKGHGVPPSHWHHGPASAPLEHVGEATGVIRTARGMVDMGHARTRDQIRQALRRQPVPRRLLPQDHRRR